MPTGIAVHDADRPQSNVMNTNPNLGSGGKEKQRIAIIKTASVAVLVTLGLALAAPVRAAETVLVGAQTPWRVFLRMGPYLGRNDGALVYGPGFRRVDFANTEFLKKWTAANTPSPAEGWFGADFDDSGRGRYPTDELSDKTGGYDGEREASPQASSFKEATDMKSAWFKKHLTDSKSTLPLSFTYDGRHSARLLAEWPAKVANERIDAQRTRRTITWTDPKTGLEVKCVAADYADYPAVEWTVYFKNTGTNTTPILKNIQALDSTFTRSATGEFVLHGNKGDWSAPESFEPYRKILSPGATQRFAPNGGRPTNGPDGWPYYNVQWTGGGVILAIGWPGQWAASFLRDEKTSLRITAGQELTHLSLKPGEEVRSPLIALLFWRGDDVVSAQNLWRRWMLTHNLASIPAIPVKPIFFGCASGLFGPTLKTTERDERQFVDAFVRERIKLDYWWIDAGWYPCARWADGVGTWEVDTQRFPAGLKAVSDHVRAKNMKQILWFEPERVERGTWIAKNHPEWVLSGKLLNLGNRDARQWLTDHVDKLISREGIDLYRQDFNMDPLDFWRKNDAPDRQGVTENLYVQGHLAYWDELQRRHPGMPIDTCASGGRRIDLETLRRSAGPHTRSDYIAFDGKPGTEPGNQGQTFGLSSWLPYYGQGVYYIDQTREQRIYNVRSYMGPAFGICVDVRRSDVDWDLYRRLVDQWRRVAPCMLGDYYPLTPYSLKPDQWIAWQFDRPEQGDGMVQAFRRQDCGEAMRVFRLCGLDPAAQYEVTNFDVAGTTVMSGKDMMDKGLTIAIRDRPGAAVIVYRRQGNRSVGTRDS